MLPTAILAQQAIELQEGNRNEWLIEKAHSVTPTFAASNNYLHNQQSQTSITSTLSQVCREHNKLLENHRRNFNVLCLSRDSTLRTQGR